MRSILILVFFISINVFCETKDTIEINSTITYLGKGNTSVDTYISILPNVEYDFRSDGIECYDALRNIIVEINGQPVDTNYYSIVYFDYMKSYFASIKFDSVFTIDREATLHLKYDSKILRNYEIEENVSSFNLYIPRAILSTGTSCYVNYNLKIKSLDTNFVPNSELQKLYQITKNKRELNLSRLYKTIDLNSANSIVFIDFIYFIDELRSNYQDLEKNINLVNLDLINEKWLSSCYGPVSPKVFYSIDFPIRKVFKLLSLPKITINISGQEIIPIRIDKNRWDSFESGKTKNPFNSIYVFDKTHNVRNILTVGFLISKNETAQIEIDLEYSSENIIHKIDAFNYRLNYGWPLFAPNRTNNIHFIKFQFPDNFTITKYAPQNTSLIEDSSSNQLTFKLLNKADYRGQFFSIDFSRVETNKYNVIYILNLALPFFLIFLFLLIRIKTRNFYNKKILIVTLTVISAFLALQMNWYTTNSLEYFFDSVQYTCTYIPIIIWLLIVLILILKREYPKNEFP